MVKNPPPNAGDVGSISGSGRSFGEENGNPLHYSCLDIICLDSPAGRGAWWTIVHGITKELVTTE